jgi:phosphate transport system substrate-binding protein
MTAGSFVSGAREILPSAPEELPKDLLKVLLFTAALPSPPLPLARLNATRDALRTRLYSAVEVAPAVPVITEVIPPPPPETDAPANTVAAAPLITGDPVIAPDPIQNGPPDNRPIVPGIIILTAPNKSRAKSQDKSASNQTASKTTTYVVPVAPIPTLNGGGSATPSRLYQSWAQRFKDAQFNYRAAGAGVSLKELRQGQIDFSGTDSFLPETQNSHTRSGDANAPFLHFPSAVNAVVLVYNVPGIYDGLRLTPELLAGIYMGEIRYWNDFRITALNPRATVPPTGIILVNRSDSSATTLTFTDYLSKISPVWKGRVGASASVTWPITGLSASSDEGVAALVHDTPYSLGYVDLAGAATSDLQHAALRNHAGHFVFAQPGNVSAAASSSIRTDGVIADFRKSITDAPGDQAYPIASLTYLLVPRTISDAQKRMAMSGFLKWMLTEGQKQTMNFQFAPLPSEFVANEQQQIFLIRNQ